MERKKRMHKRGDKILKEEGFTGCRRAFITAKPVLLLAPLSPVAVREAITASDAQGHRRTECERERGFAGAENDAMVVGSHCIAAIAVASTITTGVPSRSSCHRGLSSELLRLCSIVLPECGLSSDDCMSKLRLLLNHRSFWPLSGLFPGQFGGCCFVLLLHKWSCGCSCRYCGPGETRINCI